MRLLRRFEALAKEGRPAELPPLLPEIRAEYARVEQFLKPYQQFPLTAESAPLP